jgi:hypothetical protein
MLFDTQRHEPLTNTAFARQIDHKTSRWAGGNHAVSNLQVLRANHNLYKYRKETQLRFI